MGPINWLAVLLSAMAAFLVGFGWYGLLFGRAWLVETGLDKTKPAKIGATMLFGGHFLLLLASAAMLGHMFARIGDLPLHLYFMMSGGSALFFIIPALWTNYLYQQKSLRLAFIDAGHWLVAYLAMGAVFALLG